MVTWELLSDQRDPIEWDRNLEAGEDANVFQSYKWGEFKRASGWIPMRWVARDNGHAIVGMAQILTKTVVPGVRIGWAPGGPVFLFTGSPELDPAGTVLALVAAIEAGQGRACIRFDSHVGRNGMLAYAFNQALVRPLFRLNPGYSLNLDLAQPLDVLLKRMTSKHRYYVKKALGGNLQWKAGNDQQSVQEMVRLHTEMAEAKQLEFLKTRPQQVSKLCRVMGKNAVILTGSVENIPLTSCLVLVFGQKAFYWMAATSGKGRELSASYAMMYRLFEYLQGQGITQFDFGGVDPQSSAAEGVNHFKRGFGGELVEYLGEWEWSSSEWRRWVFNLAVHYRGSRL